MENLEKSWICTFLQKAWESHGQLFYVMKKFVKNADRVHIFQSFLRFSLRVVQTKAHDNIFMAKNLIQVEEPCGEPRPYSYV